VIFGAKRRKSVNGEQSTGNREEGNEIYFIFREVESILHTAPTKAHKINKKDKAW
jgi:hypothetical protein